MFENFNTMDFVFLGVLVLLNVIFLVLIFILLRKKDMDSNSDDFNELKVTKIDSEEKNSFDEIMNAMKKDVDSKKENAVEIFEQEQEEKAIISYQELLNVQNKITDEENIKINEIKTKVTPKLVTAKTEKFTNSEFVSPVFGKLEKNNTEADNEEQIDTHELERSLNLEPLANEIKKNNEFLNALKDFRKNL